MPAVVQCSARSSRLQRLSLRPVRGLESLVGPTAQYIRPHMASDPKMAMAPSGDTHLVFTSNQSWPGTEMSTPCSGEREVVTPSCPSFTARQ